MRTSRKPRTTRTTDRPEMAAMIDQNTRGHA